MQLRIGEPRPLPSRVALVACLCLTLASALVGQQEIGGREEIDFDRTESWAMKYFSSVVLFTGFGAPHAMDPGALEVALEGGWVPSLSQDQQRVGFNGTKLEDLNQTSVLFRPRVRVGLPRALTLEAGWIPPLEINGIEPNLFSLAIARSFALTERQRLGLRLYGQGGSIDGDFTCSSDTVAAGDDSVLNPFRCEAVSEDTQTLEAVGLEVSWAVAPMESSRWEFHVGMGVHRMDLEFQVRALYGGLVDRTLLATDGITMSAVAGASYLAGERHRLTGELFYSPLDVVRPPQLASANDGLFNVRALYSYKVR